MTVRIELHADGAIALAVPDRDVPRSLATMEQAGDWAAHAAREGNPVEVSGAVTATLALPVVELVRARAPGATVTETTPAPLDDGLTAVQVAARHGLVRQLVDLLERGAPTDSSDPERSPYWLAARRGHITSLRALRSAGVPDSLQRRRPREASPDAIVLRPLLTRLRRRIIGAALVAPLLLGGLGTIALGDPAALLTGAVVTAACLPLVAMILWLARNAGIAIDGTELYVGQPFGWKGPVDLANLVAIGYTPQFKRTPAYLRLIQTSAGSRLLPGSLVGFEKDVAKAIREQSGLKTLLVGFKGSYLMPGLPRFIGQCTDGTDLVLSPPARAFLRQHGALRDAAD